MFLKIEAQLDNVTDLQPVDSLEQPFEYVFIIKCNSCQEEHSKPVSINCYEQHEISGSRGEASFVFKCSMCKRQSSTSIKRTKHLFTAESDGLVPLLEIDSRGMELVKFVPEGHFSCKGVDSPTRFNEVDLIEGDWYDYDENSGNEVSVTDVRWVISA